MKPLYLKWYELQLEQSKKSRHPVATAVAAHALGITEKKIYQLKNRCAECELITLRPDIGHGVFDIDGKTMVPEQFYKTVWQAPRKLTEAASKKFSWSTVQFNDEPRAVNAKVRTVRV